MGYTIVTNNDKCRTAYQGRYTVAYNRDWTYLDVLLHTRDLIHRGAQLITHPMAGSLKPNQTPYRSVVVGGYSLEDKAPWRDVALIEQSIEACEKFLRCRPLPRWQAQALEDFRTLDLSFLEGALSPARAHGDGSGRGLDINDSEESRR